MTKFKISIIKIFKRLRKEDTFDKSIYVEENASSKNKLFTKFWFMIFSWIKVEHQRFINPIFRSVSSMFFRMKLFFLKTFRSVMGWTLSSLPLCCKVVTFTTVFKRILENLNFLQNLSARRGLADPPRKILLGAPPPIALCSNSRRREFSTAQTSSRETKSFLVFSLAPIIFVFV